MPRSYSFQCIQIIPWKAIIVVLMHFLESQAVLECSILVIFKVTEQVQNTLKREIFHRKSETIEVFFPLNSRVRVSAHENT